MNEKEKIVLIFLSAFFILGSLISYFNGKRKNTILKEEIVKQEIKEDRKVTKKKININEASQKELISLPGIGEKIAQRIIEYRQKEGKFKSKSELLKIKGIGKKRLSRIEDLIEIK